jgi:type II secretory pathway pseudopilin PulG
MAARESRPTADVDNQALNPESKKQGTQDKHDRSGKSATRQQMLIVNDLAGNTKSNKPATCCSFSGFINPLPRVKKSHSERAFTMIEIAIAVGVIGFALVAIIGILPQGMNVQKDNREDTIISQDAPYFLNAIRNGEMRTNYGVLSNYVESITISNVNFGTNITYSNPFLTNGGEYLLTNDMNIIGFLSTPEYDPRLTLANGVLLTNEVTAIVHAMTGSAIQQNGANSAMSFRYQLTVENVPWNSIAYDSTNWDNNPPLNNSPYALNSPDYIIRSNRWVESQFLTNILHEVRLKFAWPVLPNGNIGPGRQTYRSLISSHLWSTNIYGTFITNWFFQPQTYTNNMYSF